MTPTKQQVQGAIAEYERRLKSNEDMVANTRASEPSHQAAKIRMVQYETILAALRAYEGAGTVEPFALPVAQAKSLLALKYAVEAIYFEDSSYYMSALWAVVRATGGNEAVDLLDKEPHTAYERYATPVGIAATNLEDGSAAEPPEVRPDEPVAWRYVCRDSATSPLYSQHKHDWVKSGSGFWTETPLFTAPSHVAPSSGNYIANDPTNATEIIFANGRRVWIGENGFLQCEYVSKRPSEEWYKRKIMECGDDDIGAGPIDIAIADKEV